MRIALVAVLALFLQDPTYTLKYGGGKSDKVRVTMDWKLTLDVDGTEAGVNFIRSSNEFFSFKKIHVLGDAVRTFTPAGRETGHKIDVPAARVEAIYDDKPEVRDFSRTSPPADLDKKKLEQILWFLSMAPREFGMTASGELHTKDATQEAWGESLEMIGYTAIRLSEKPVKVGEEWTAEWKSRARQKDNGGRFAYKQKAKVEKIAEKGGRKRANVSFEITGVLDVPDDGKKDPNMVKAETTFAGKGRLELDVESGVVYSSDSSGEVKSYFKHNDPNGGGENEVTVTMKMAGKITERD